MYAEIICNTPSMVVSLLVAGKGQHAGDVGRFGCLPTSVSPCVSTCASVASFTASCTMQEAASSFESVASSSTWPICPALPGRPSSHFCRPRNAGTRMSLAVYESAANSLEPRTAPSSFAPHVHLQPPKSAMPKPQPALVLGHKSRAPVAGTVEHIIEMRQELREARQEKIDATYAGQPRPCADIHEMVLDEEMRLDTLRQSCDARTSVILPPLKSPASSRSVSLART